MSTPPDREKLYGLARWLTTLDHRDVGLLYLAFGTACGLLGAFDALALRTHLLTPEANVVAARTYDALFTTHGVTMLFLFATPVFVGLANYLVPLLVGADDMAFPRVNALAFWLLPPAALLVRAGAVTDLLGVRALAPPATGWTLYPPMSIRMANPSVDLLLLGLHLTGLSTLLSAINFIATVVVEREVGWHRLDIFTWSVLTTSGLVLFAFPLLGSALLMLLADRNFGSAFFTVDGGGPILWQHLFWFFGHPEVYILVLPPMGVVSYVLPRFAGRRLFGFRSVVYSTLAIGALSFGVWAHHMFTTGMDPRVQASFMAVTLAIAVPSAVKTFNWIATLWNGRVRLTAPLLFCVGAVANFVVGGVTGVVLAAIPVDLVLHGTYYVVGHFHLVLVGFVLFAGFAACYYWFPLLTGRRYDPWLARTHFWLTALGTPTTFLPLLVLGSAGLPRRMATYPAQFATLQRVATVGAFVLGAAQALWLWNLVRSARHGPPAGPDPWDLADTPHSTREWAHHDPDRGRRTAHDHGDRDGPAADRDR